MRETIQGMLKDGKTRKEIAVELQISYKKVSYYSCDRTLERKRRWASTNKYHNLNWRCAQFCSLGGAKPRPYNKDRFNYRAVLEKFGEDTHCYLTGKPVNLLSEGYHFDHILARSRGGQLSIDNLGIACTAANQAKGALTVDELLDLCTEILQHHGFTVAKYGQRN